MDAEVRGAEAHRLSLRVVPDAPSPTRRLQRNIMIMVQVLEHGSQQKAQSERVAALEKGQTALQTELAALKDLVATQAGQLSAAHERIDATLGTE